MAFLNDRQRRILQIVCDTFVPKLIPEDGDDHPLFDFRASAHDVPAQMERIVEEVGGSEGQRRFKRVLKALNSRLASGFMAGMWERFSELSLEERTKLLAAWRDSHRDFARRVFQAVKRITLFLAYATPDSDGRHPAWNAIGYPGSCQKKRQFHATPPIKTLQIDRSTTIDAEVLVIGSGAGGGVVAAELAAAGKDVLVVEKGDYFPDSELPGDELNGTAKLYEKQGKLTTDDLSIVVLAGSTLGGGTTVNWMTSLAPPDDVLREWSRDFGFAAATSDEFQRSLQAVSERINVNTNHSELNGTNGVLDRGCRELNYRCNVIPRNVKDCEDCDFCGFGCRYGAKQDTRKTFLQDAFDGGARILPGAHVNRILHDSGVANGAQLIVNGTNGQSHAVNVRSKIVVTAAGSIHTPAILTRSGISGKQIGANLHLHPTTAVFARYSEPVCAWQGVPQSRYCDEFADLDGAGFGVRIETAPTHPGLCAQGLPWHDPREHKRLMQHLDHHGNLIILTRDRHGGRVRTNRVGEPVLQYSLHEDDAKHMMRGVEAGLRIQLAAGAEEVHSPHGGLRGFRSIEERSFDEYLSEVHNTPIRPNAFGLFSAHQLCTCRISNKSSQGAVNPEGRLYGLDNLYVADGSVLPTPCGVNPMITIMGLANFIAQHIKAEI